MKKFIALAAAFAMVFTICTPAFAATDKGKQLEELILKAKTAIEVPNDLSEFTSSSRTDEDGTTFWNLNWSEKPISEQVWDRKSISVEINDDGFINSYSKYESGKRYSEYVKIPAVSKDEATASLKSFISKVCPQIENEIDWKEPNVSDGSYFFNFRRVKDGIDAGFNNASFVIDGKTGEVASYYSNWNTKLQFPAADKAITLEKAKEVYKAQMPLNLEYRINSDGQVYIQYSPSREKNGYYINAVTGELEKIQQYFIPYASEKAMDYNMKQASGALLPGEQKEVDAIAGTISAADAEKKLRAMSELSLDSSYKLSSSHLSQNKTTYNKETFYFLSLYFTRLNPDEKLTDEQAKLKIAAGDGIGSASATFNAVTGDLISYYGYSWIEPRTKLTDKAKSKENYKKTADAFIAKYQANKAGLVKFADMGSNTDFQYFRVEKGIYFDNDGISVSVDEKTGKISQYNYTWTDKITIPSADGVISTDKAHQVLFDNVGFKLEYVMNDKKVVLVYKTNDEKPALIDALSGEHIDYSGKPFKGTVAPEYKDIAGHFAEAAIKELLNVGVFLNGDTFSPDSNILQKDYVSLLSKLGKFYYGDSNIDVIYNYMIKNGIMDESEKNPDGFVTREDAVKYLLRYLDYKKLAEIPGIFNCDFADVQDINPSLIGYAAIAKGLGVVKGSDGNFKPKDILTKGESAVIIYNCIKANI